MSDTDIARTLHRVLATLLDDRDAVHVEVEQGVVYLEGIARTAAHKQRIEQITRHVPGVRQVINCLALEHLANLHADLALLWPVLPDYLPPARRAGGRA